MAVCSGCSACGTQDASQSTDSTATNLGFMSFPFLDLGPATRGAPAGSASVTIPGATRRAPANGAADRADACADRRAFPGVSSDRSAHSSHGRSAGSPAQRPSRHRLARRLPVIIRRRIILGILRSRGNWNCRKNPGCCAAANDQTNHFQLTNFLPVRGMLRLLRMNGNGRQANGRCYGTGGDLIQSPLAVADAPS